MQICQKKTKKQKNPAGYSRHDSLNPWVTQKLMNNSVGYSNISNQNLIHLFSWQVFIDCWIYAWGYRSIQDTLSLSCSEKE